VSFSDAEPVTGVQRYARNVVAAMNAVLADAEAHAPIIAPPFGHRSGLRGDAALYCRPLTGQLWEQVVLAARWHGASAETFAIWRLPSRPIRSFASTTPMYSLRRKVTALRSVRSTVRFSALYRPGARLASRLFRPTSARQIRPLSAGAGC